MKILSLFDGISCARVALERAGIPVEAYYASEIDKYAIEISKKNYPEILHLSNVKNLNTEESFDYLDMVPHYSTPKDSRIDLLIGGSPCQDLSIAKRNRKGLDGERSGLFWEYVRILKEVKPKYFILENVASMPQEARDTITKTLGVEPIMINASLVSAQRRKRLFWTNIPNMKLPEDRGIMLREIIEPHVDEKYYVKDETIKKICQRLKDRKPLGQALRIHSIDGKSVALTEQRTEEAKELRREHKKKFGKDFCPRRAKELVPRDDGKMNTLTTGVTNESLVLVLNENGAEQENSRTLRTSGMGSGFGDKHNWDQIAIVTTPRGHNAGGVSFDKAPTLTKSSYEHNNHLVEMIENGTARIRRLTPIECERLQGVPDGFTEGFTDSQRYKMLGNAFNVDVIAHILSFIPTEIVEPLKRWRP